MDFRRRLAEAGKKSRIGCIVQEFDVKTPTPIPEVVEETYRPKPKGDAPQSAKIVTSPRTENKKKAPREKTPFKWSPKEAERTTLFPILHDDLWACRKHIESLHWTVEEVDISKDRFDWLNRMIEAERRAVRYILGFFAIADNFVLKSLPSISDEVDCLEAKCFYSGQEDQECTHMEAYMLQIDAVAADEKEKQFMLDAVKNMPAVKNLAEWAQEWMSSERSFWERFISQAFLEGVGFSGFFGFIQVNLRDRNLCPGITLFNTFIMRDEGEHCKFAALLLKKYAQSKPTQEMFQSICMSGYKAVAAMIDEAIPEPLRHISGDRLKAYMRYQTDCFTVMAGYELIYGEKNPFPSMDQASLNEVTKVNFFEKVVSQYRGPKPGAAIFSIDESPIDV